MVLRTSVTYNTQKATLQLTDDQRHKADELSREAQQANQAGKYGDAIRSLYQGLAVMRNVPWTPALEFVSSLQGKLDHAIVEPGAQVSVTLTPLYATPRAAGIKLSASLVLVPVKKEGASPKPLGAPVAVDPAATPFTTRVALPETPAGDYTIEVRLAADGEAPAASARGAFVKTLPLHIDTLADSVQRLRGRLAKAPKKDGLASAEYAMALYERADSGELNPARVNFREEFAAANAILERTRRRQRSVCREARRFPPGLPFRRGSTRFSLTGSSFPNHTMHPKPRRCWSRCTAWAATRTACSIRTRTAF